MGAFKTAVGGCCCEADPTPVDIEDCATFKEAFIISGSPETAAITMEVELSGITNGGSCPTCLDLNSTWMLWSDVATILSGCVVSEGQDTGVGAVCSGFGTTFGIFIRFGTTSSGAWEFNVQVVQPFGTSAVFGWTFGANNAASLAGIQDLYDNGEYTLPFASQSGATCGFSGATCTIRWAPL